MKNLLLLTITILSLFTNDCISQNIWQPTSGPHGADMVDVLITSDNILVISEKNSGIFFSNDKGDSWQKISKGLNNQNDYAESLAAGLDGIVYAVINSGLYKLNGKANEWIKLNYAVPSGSNIIANGFGELYFINENASSIDYSNNQGETFQNILTIQKLDKIIHSAIMGNNNNFIIGTENGINNLYRMNNDGSGLIKIMDSVGSVEHLFWHPAGYIFMNTSNTDLIRIDRDGANRINHDSFDLIVNKFAIKPNGDLMAFTDEHDYISPDLGLNWYIISSKLYTKINIDSKILYHENDFYSFSFNNYCGNNSFQRTSDNGISWTFLENASSKTRVYDVFVDKSGHLFTKACHLAKYAYSQDKGETWEELNMPEFDFFFVSFSSDLVSSASGDLFLRLDDGIIYKKNILDFYWSELLLPETTKIIGLAGDHNSIIYAFGNPTSWMSNDGGKNWSKIGTPELTFNPNKIYFHPDGTLFVLHQDLIHRIIPEVAISYDNGMNWNTLNLNLFRIESFTISKKGTIYLSTSSTTFGGDTLFASHDKLQTLNSVKPGGYYRALITGNDETIYATNGFACEKSSDGGINWEPFNAGIPAGSFATCIAADENQHLYLGFDDDVVYKTERTVTSVNELNLSSRILIQPNPVESEMNIAISSKNISTGHYKIIGLHGVEMLRGKFHSNNFTIDCSSLPSGMAFIQIYGKENIFATKKIIIAH